MSAADRPRAARADSSLAIGASAAAVAAAVGLRLWNLRDQVLGGDELHAVATALARPLGWILTTYSLADYSIPLTAAIRLWLEAGGGLTEIGLRVPGLVASVALVVLVAIAATRAFGAAAGARAAWLVAAAPALVLYGRIVRSYSPMVLLAIGAAIAGWRWIETGSLRAAATYVALAATAIWFHLGAAPFVCAPLGFAAVLRLAAWRKPRALAPSGEAIAATAFVLVVACSAFFLPAAATLAMLVATIRSNELPDVDGWLAVVRLQAGAPDAWLALVACALAALGLVSLARSRPRLAWYGATLVVAQVGGLLVLRPDSLDLPLALNRYLLPCTAVSLAWIALGLGAIAPTRPRVAMLATVLLVGLLLARGPLAAPSYWRGSFAHANEVVSFEDGARLGVEAAQLPSFYRELAASTPATVVELPWHAWWQFSRLFPADQSAHRARVLVSGEIPHLDDPRVAFRNFAWPAPDQLAATGATWVVVHLDLEAEQQRMRGLPRLDVLRTGPPATIAQTWEELRSAAARAAVRLEIAWGPPDVVEPGLRAWRLPRADPAVTKGHR